MADFRTKRFARTELERPVATATEPMRMSRALGCFGELAQNSVARLARVRLVAAPDRWELKIAMDPERAPRSDRADTADSAAPIETSDTSRFVAE